MDDTELAQKMVDKYPQYKSQVNFEQPEEERPQIGTMEGFVDPFKQSAIGISKGVGKIALGIGTLGRNIQKAVTPKALEDKMLGGGGVFDTGSQKRSEVDEMLAPKTKGQAVSSFVTEVGATSMPSGAAYKATRGLGFITRIRNGKRVLDFRKISGLGATGGTTGTILGGGDIDKDTAIGAGVDVALPVFGKLTKPAFNFVRRLFKGMGSGLSGVSTDAIDTMVQNPKKALEVSKHLDEVGNFKVLEDNAKVILNGVSKVRQGARKAYGDALEGLKEVDIKPTTFRQATQSFLDSVQSSVEGGVRTIKNVEFENPKNIKRATELIDELQNVKLDGKSLRAFMKKVGDRAYKTTGTDSEKLAFNAFIKNMENSVKKAISQSTNKLDDINKTFSQDMQLAEAVESILGKAKFKNTKEVADAARKLDGLFSKKGLDPKIVDDFLTRIGVSPEDFRTTEAVRQIMNQAQGKNTMGTNPFEVAQRLTAALVTPESVKKISIATGLASKVIQTIVDTVEPTARVTLIKALVDSQKEEGEQGVGNAQE